MLKQLLELKHCREEGIRRSIRSLDLRKAELTERRLELLERRRVLATEREALFDPHTLLEPDAFQKLKHKLARLYDEEKSIAAQFESVRNAIVECETTRDEKQISLHQNLRGQEKLSYLIENSHD